MIKFRPKRAQSIQNLNMTPMGTATKLINRLTIPPYRIRDPSFRKLHHHISKIRIGDPPYRIRFIKPLMKLSKIMFEYNWKPCQSECRATRLRLKNPFRNPAQNEHFLSITAKKLDTNGNELISGRHLRHRTLSY